MRKESSSLPSSVLATVCRVQDVVPASVPEYTSGPPELSQASSETAELKRNFDNLKTKTQQYKKQIKTLQQCKRRLKKKVASLSAVIKALKDKHLVDDSSLNILESIPGMQRDLLQRQTAKTKAQAVPRTYSPELRSFALTLHFYSHRAYNYVRRCFNTCLPHPRTLSKWYQCVGGAPGFTSEAFKVVKAKVCHPETKFQTLCSLVVDEIAIRQHLEFDGTCYYGYVDMGSSVDTDNLPVAKEAFVLMLVAINASWKLPVGYFLTAGITGEQKAELVKQCIDLANSSGVQVVSVTCDGSASNLSMARCLGCNLSCETLRSTFSLEGNDHEMSFFLDPPHMLKLVRNALGDKKLLWDGQGGVISWHVLELLHKLQVKEGLHLGNKITARHLNFFKNKMKVKLATQLLSNSVADAIQYCSDMKLPGFEQVSATVRFIRIFNCLFDVCNSRTLLQSGFKQALNTANFSTVEGFLLEAQRYIKELTVGPNPQAMRVVDSNRKTGFIGFLVCISSVLHMYSKLVGTQTHTPVLKFLPLYKCSQDHLEMFFSAIRSRGGWNNNPTARQFVAAYKRLLIHSEIRESEKGNCMSLEEIPILTFSSSNVEDHINCTSEQWQLVSMENSAATPDHDYFATGTYLSEVAIHIVVYIAGFVVRHLEKRLNCEPCLSVLRGDGSHVAYSLTHRKSRGWLVLPSNDVVDICVCAEKVFRCHTTGNSKVPLKNLFFKCVSEVLGEFIFKPVFKELADHMKNQHPLDNHMILLIKAIATRYLLTRQKHATKRISDALHENKIRTTYTKLVLFKGQ